MKFLLIALSAAAFQLPLLSAEKNTSEQEIQSLLRDYVEKEKRSPGIVVGTVDAKGSRVFSFGKVRADSDLKVNGDTIFQIGSVTKTFTTLLLQQMIDRGEVNLDDPVAKLLPASVKVPSRNGRQITLLDLATHTSGLPRMPSFKTPRDGRFTMKDVYEFLSDYELTRDIGAQYEYSNLGVGLLGHALHLKAGTIYETLVEKQICDPLKMNDTRITLTPEMKEHAATAHSESGEPLLKWSQPTFLAAGSICSSGNDMVKYISAQLGTTPSPLFEAMQKTQQPRRKAAGTLQVALGWHVRKFNDSEAITHNGATVGFHSSVAFDPKNHCGVVVLVNSANEIGDLPFTILKQLSAEPNVAAKK